MRTSIIVLGQSLNPDGTIPSVLESRIIRARKESEKHPDALVIVSGGDPAGTGVSEAAVMKKFLPQAILEDKSRNTFENAYECSKILRDYDIERVKLVSSGFHLPRASYLFEAVFAAVSLEIELEQIPTETFEPYDTDKGINSLDNDHRKSHENKLLGKLKGKTHLPYELEGKSIPSLGEDRLNQAIAQLNGT